MLVYFTSQLECVIIFGGGFLLFFVSMLIHESLIFPGG